MTRALSLESGSIVPSVSQVAILPSSRSTQGLTSDAPSSSSYDAFFDQLYNYDQLLSTRSRLRTNSIWSSSSSSSSSSTTTRTSSSSDTNTRSRSDHIESRHDSFPSMDDDDDRPDTITDVNTSDKPYTSKASSTTTTNKRHFFIRSKKITSSNLSESNLDSDDSRESSSKGSSSSSSGSGGSNGKVIQALDLSSIPVLTAPSITDPAPAPAPTDLGRRINNRKLSSSSDDPVETLPHSAFTHRQPHACSPPPSPSSSSSGLISEIMQSESYQIAIGASPKQRHSVSSTSSAMILRPQAMLSSGRAQGYLNEDEEAEDEEIDKSEIEITISPTGRSSTLPLHSDSSHGTDTMLATVEVSSVPLNNHAMEPSVLTEVITTTPSYALALLDRSPDDMYQAASRTLGDIQETRIQMVDLDDQNSALFRKVRLLL